MTTMGVMDSCCQESCNVYLADLLICSDFPAPLRPKGPPSTPHTLCWSCIGGECTARRNVQAPPQPRPFTSAAAMLVRELHRLSPACGTRAARLSDHDPTLAQFNQGTLPGVACLRE